MSPSNDDNRPSSSSSDADLAQAYKDLARGEQAATALEANLAHLESKLDGILAALEQLDPEPKTELANDKANGDGHDINKSVKKDTTEVADDKGDKV